MKTITQEPGRGVVGGVAYTLGANYAVRFMNLAVSVLLARDIGPYGMGIVAAALITLEMIDTIRDFGLREALIYERNLDKAFMITAFYMILTVSLLQAFVMAGVGLASSSLGLDVDLGQMLPWLAIIFVLNALGSPQEALLLREGRFGARAVADFAGTSVKLVATALLLQMGGGLFSIVPAMLAGVALRTSCLWYFSRWRPCLDVPRLAAIRPMFGYGKHIIAVNIMALCRSKGDQFLVATLLGATALGSYFLAARIPEIVIFGVNVAISSVAFPTFARIHRDGGSLADAYLRTVRAALLLMAPAAIGIAATSHQIVPFLFGPEWSDTAKVLAILSLGGIPLTLGWSSGDVFKATGRPHLLTFISLAELGIAMPIIAAAIILSRDVTVVAGAMVLCETLSCALRLFFMARHERTPVGRVLLSITPILLSALTMGAVVVFAGDAMINLSPGLRLLLTIVTGLLTFIAMILLVDRHSVKEFRLLLASRKEQPTTVI